MKHIILFTALLSLSLLACGGSRVVADPNINNQRLNGFTPILVYASPAVYAHRYYPVVCQIEPFKYFTTGESDALIFEWRKVSSSAGECQGWAYVP